MSRESYSCSEGRDHYNEDYAWDYQPLRAPSLITQPPTIITYNVKEEIKDYEKLNNKPQINGYDLYKNKTASDLGLQDKLIAGENITISDDNVISAENNGVTSYEDLTDKPRINDIPLEGNKSASDLGLQRIIENYFTVQNNEYLTYDFNKIPYLSSTSTLYCIPFIRVTNFPVSLSDKVKQSGTLYIFHYIHTTVGAKYLIRRIMARNFNDNYVEFAQYCVITDNSSTVIMQSDWAELTGGGSQIVSGVVNANGTITFTDSGGNTFTTTGSSVIGPRGNDYVLTEKDKTDIANIVLNELENKGYIYTKTDIPVELDVE